MFIIFLPGMCVLQQERLRDGPRASAILLWAFRLLHTDFTKMAGSRFEDLAVFNKAKAIFFYKTMTTSMVSDGPKKPMTLELPTLFASDHGKEMKEVVALVRPTCESSVWWLRFEAHHFSHYKSRVFTRGDGCRNFVLENGIRIGDFLVFELVNNSRFVVHVYPPDQLGNARGFCRSGEEAESELLNPSSNVDEEMSQDRPTWPSSPSDKVALEYQFMKTICPSNGIGSKARLDIPAIFWRFHGCDKSDLKLYTLEGPQMKGHVRANVSRTQEQTKCAFGVGWKSFYVANKLKIGDTVVFTLTGEFRLPFQLHKLSPI